MLNDKMITLWDSITTEDSTDKARIAELKKDNRQIASICIQTIGKLRDAGEYNPDAIDSIVDQLDKKIQFKQYMHNIITMNVKDNMAVDVYLQYNDDVLTQQRESYSV
jgi:hypothetical protein